jgi:ferritin-like metal-binding protein YciE
VKEQSLKQLYIEQLKDLYSAEGQLVQALPKMAKAASSPALQKAITMHLEETKGHRDTVGGLFDGLDASPRGKKCKAMEGLIEEGSEVIKEHEEGSVRDAALIAAAQRVEHYEIASYGTVCEFAQLLGQDMDYRALSGILDQEKAADEKLNKIATSEVNQAANSVAA